MDFMVREITNANGFERGGKKKKNPKSVLGVTKSLNATRNSEIYQYLASEKQSAHDESIVRYNQEMQRKVERSQKRSA